MHTTERAAVGAGPGVHPLMRLLLAACVPAVALESADAATRGAAHGLWAERGGAGSDASASRHSNSYKSRPESGDGGVGSGGAGGDRAAGSRQTALHQLRASMRYNIGAGVAGQYVFNPCDGLWTAGDVCPEILDCAVQEKMGTGETVFPDEENACKITGLPGWGYNPSVVPAPKWLRERAKWQLGLSDKVAFVATSRVKASNKPVACLNPKVVDWDIRRRANATASDLVLLDAHWNILFSMPIRGGHCEDNPESVQDARLFLAGGTEAGNETIFVTYPNPDPNTHIHTANPNPDPDPDPVPNPNPNPNPNQVHDVQRDTEH